MRLFDRDHAFTLLEFLVVIGIIAVLLGLILPAIQKVRAAAERAKCQNNLKQIGSALHQYHDTQRALPFGHRSPNNPDKMPYSGWTLDILPFLEQQMLYGSARTAYRLCPWPFLNPPHTGLASPVRVYLCPSDPRTDSPQLAPRSGFAVAFTSYLGVAGKTCFTRDGVLVHDSRFALTDVTDGTSTTLLVGERPPSADLQFGWWYAGLGQLGSGSADLILGVRERNLQPVTSGSPCGPGAYPFIPSNVGDPCGMFHFWSPHSGGAHFAFCDGSVRFVSYSVNNLLPALASRAGGEVVNEP